MTLIFSEKNKVRIIICEYVKNIIDTARLKSKGLAITPAFNHMLDIKKYSPLLVKKYARRFYTLTTKLLFLSKRVRSDILTAVAFLTIRVKSTTKSDDAKLTGVIRYFQFTTLLDLTLDLDKTKVIKWRSDASIAVHLGMKIHTGNTVKIGKGAVYFSSTH